MARGRGAPYVEPVYGPNRFSWMTAGRVEFIVYDGSEKGESVSTDDQEEEVRLPSYADALPVRPLRLSIRRIGRRPLTLNLTYYTVEELIKMRALINKAFDIAMKRSKILDDEAKRLALAGDDTIPRVYRMDPHVIERPGVLTRPNPDGTVPVH